MKQYKITSFLLRIGLVFLFVALGNSSVQSRPLEETAVSLQIESISGPDEQGAYHIKGSATPRDLRPDPNTSFSNYLSVYAEFMNTGGKWPIFYEFYSIGWACYGIGERCIDEEEEYGINVKTANLVSVNLNYEDDGKPVLFDVVVTLPEGAQQMRVVARLEQVLHGNPWDATSFHWAEHGPIAVKEITPQPPQANVTMTSKSQQNRDITPTPLVADLNIENHVTILQAIEKTNLVANRDVGIFIQPIWNINIPSELPPIQVSVTIDNFKLKPQTKTGGNDFSFVIPAKQFWGGNHQIQIKAIHIGEQIIDPNPANNVFVENVTAHNSRPMRLLFTRIQPRSGQVVSLAQLNQLAHDAVTYLRQVYPVPSLQRIQGSYYVLPGSDMRISVSVAVAKTLVQYNANRCLQIKNGVVKPIPDCKHPRADLAVGVVPRGQYGDAEGWLFGRGSSIWGSWLDATTLGFGWLTSGESIDRAPITVVNNYQNLAHEIGHHFNLEDEYSNDSVGIVIPSGMIWKDGRFIEIAGEPVTYYNFMGNAGVGLGAQDYWVNAKTWNHILAEITSNGIVNHPNKVASLTDMPTLVNSYQTETIGPALLVAGSINQQGQGTIYSIDQLFRYDTFPNSQGPLRLEARSASGEIVGEISFDTYPFTIEAEVPFLVTLPISDFSQVAEIRIYHGETQLAKQIRSTNMPSVAFDSQPNFSNDSINLSWTAQDADGDDLRSSIYYSVDDGQSWQVIILDTPETSLTLDSAELPGGTAQFRLIVSDGFNETQILSDPTDVADHLPSVEIQSPWGTTFPPETAVILQSFADDLEDGTLPDQDLIWTDQNNQVLGFGPLLHTNDLSAGQHQITLTATDSAGQSAQATISITLESAPQTNSQKEATLPDNTLLYGSLICLGLLCTGLMGLAIFIAMFWFIRRSRPAPARQQAKVTQDDQGRWWSQDPATGTWFWWDGQAWQAVQAPPQPRFSTFRPPRGSNTGIISCLGALIFLGLLIMLVGGGVSLIMLGFIPEWQPSIPASPSLKDALLMGGSSLLLPLFGGLMIRGGLKSIITRHAVIVDDETGYRQEVGGCSAIFSGLTQLFFGLLLAACGIGLATLTFFQYALPWIFPMQ